MRFLLMICSVALVGLMAWRQSQVESELEIAKAKLDAANESIAKLSSVKRVATPLPNWIQERNRNWQSPLGRGGYDNHQVTSPPVIYGAPGSYYTDSVGRYWLDSAGGKHYVQ